MADLTPRAEFLLKSLVERYIADGQPVGSRTLAKQAGLDLSPATVRNVMADLEELGLVRSPHTSAGRVPTQLGYRVFIDSLLTVHPLGEAEIRKYEGEFLGEEDPHHLIEAASHLLSEVTQLAALIMVPRRDRQVTLRQLEFVSLSAQRVLVILVTEDGQVQNRIIHTERRYSPAELVQAANYFNETFSGMAVAAVKRTLLAEMRRVTEDMHRTMKLAVEMAGGMLLDEKNVSNDLLVSGESNLMEFPELGDIQKLRRLFETFTAKRDLLHLLDRSMRAGGVKIFIGSESGYDALEDCSVVAAPYTVDGQVLGTLGVIGPTRMPYEQVIPFVDVTAKLLGGALSARGR
ncbi:MAG: heat-inducible transcriptional repressor HrcA [Acidiferrobacterales bacterium]